MIELLSIFKEALFYKCDHITTDAVVTLACELSGGVCHLGLALPCSPDVLAYDVARMGVTGAHQSEPAVSSSALLSVSNDYLTPSQPPHTYCWTGVHILGSKVC